MGRMSELLVMLLLLPVTMGLSFDTTVAPDPCHEPLLTGYYEGPHCQPFIMRYYYNAKSFNCEQFMWTGCRQNSNNFDTKEQCQSRCLNPAVCYLPPDTTQCGKAHPRYYHNPSSGLCEGYFDGGCARSGNSFRSVEECRHVCKPKSCDPPRDTGFCGNRSMRFYFNKMSGKCEPFTYGGCSSDVSYFYTEWECMETCSVMDVCQLPRETGPCKAFIMRYYYDTETERCETFTYGGCNGNGNNFGTKQECKQTCLPEAPPPTGFDANRTVYIVLIIVMAAILVLVIAFIIYGAWKRSDKSKAQRNMHVSVVSHKP